MFSQSTIAEIEEVALKEDIEPAALLAVCEVESGGKAFSFVAGRREPIIRFEGHYFDRLIAPSKRHAARKAGLSSPRAGQVKNPRSQADRWRLLNKAIKLDKAAALQSVSWGIGQVMGAHWKSLGYASPDALAAEARASVAGQVALMIRFIRSKGLDKQLGARDWAGFARVYNGPQYKRNNYDLRMASAYERHRNRALLAGEVLRPRSDSLSMMRFNDALAVREMQKTLNAAGFILKVDGLFGVQTDKALRAFQQSRGLKVDGVYSKIVRAALSAALPKSGIVGSLISVARGLLQIVGFRKLRKKT